MSRMADADIDRRNAKRARVLAGGLDDLTGRVIGNPKLSRAYVKASREDVAHNCRWHDAKHDGGRCMADGLSCQDAIHGRRDCPLHRMK